MVSSSGAHHAGNHKSGLETLCVLQKKLSLSQWQESAKKSAKFKRIQGKGEQLQPWLLPHIEWPSRLPTTCEVYKSTCSNFPSVKSITTVLLPSSKIRAKIVIVFNRSPKSSKAAQMQRNGFLQKTYKILLDVKSVLSWESSKRYIDFDLKNYL